MTDWPTIHEKVVEQFRAGWDRPEPHAWDSFLDDSMRFIQPMLRDGIGPQVWWEEMSRTLKLLPDLRADVLRWAGSHEDLFIHLRLEATVAGKPLTWEAVDRLRVGPDGTAVFRESFFDSVPIAAILLRRPRSWLPWWRSGVGPLFWRRRLLRPIEIPTHTGGTP
ncbi:MAG TPA: nuclear transport factor 2 family protein [Aeromicrobium sp.]|nr:nuclear transport factor 2 family protein [Aeromicrobium sp.]